MTYVPLFPRVRDYLAARPGEWIPADEVAKALGGLVTISSVEAEFGSMHDMGLATKIGGVPKDGYVGAARARWDAPPDTVEPTLPDLLAADARAASRAEYAMYYRANPSELGENNPEL